MEGLKLFVISKVGMAQDGRRWSIRALGLSAQVVEGLVNIKRENQPRQKRRRGVRSTCRVFVVHPVPSLSTVSHHQMMMMSLSAAS